MNEITPRQKYWHLFRAEWEKIAGNRIIASFLIWIFPLGVLVGSALAFIVMLFDAGARESLRTFGVYPWHDAFLTMWQIINTPISRFTIVAFSAIVFATEYQNGTWKYLVTRRARTTLILNKFFTLIVFMVTAFVMANVIHGIAQGLAALFVGVSFGEFNGELLADFLREGALNLVVITLAAFFGALYAALAAMVTGNVIGSVMAGVVLTLIEDSILLIHIFINSLFDLSIISIYRFSPSYNLANINSWARGGDGFSVSVVTSPDVPPDGFEALPLPVSMFIILLWIVGLMWLTVTIFRSSDIRD